jgi:glucokinase
MFIVADIGASNTRLGASKNLKKIDCFKIFSTDKNFFLEIKKIQETIDFFCKNKKLKAVVLGMPGVLNSSKDKLVKSPNLKKWENKNIVKMFSSKFNCPVFLENDANLAGLGEAHFGAGKNKKIIAYLTIGTGTGGTRIINGKIDQSFQTFEPGHQIIKFNGKKCTCGQKGCFEAYCSGKSFFKKYKIKPEDCHSQKIWQNYTQKLVPGIINITVLWSPEIIILGGGVSKSPYLMSFLKKNLKKELKILNVPLIVKSKLKDKAGIYGGISIFKKTPLDLF